MPRHKKTVLTQKTKEEIAELQLMASHANQLIQHIAGSEHHFFKDQKTGFISSFEIGIPYGEIYFIDYYSLKYIDTSQSFYKDWDGFTSGGTLKDLVHRMSNYIREGTKVPLGVIGLIRADRLSCVWGHSMENILKLQEEVSSLPIISVPEPQ